MAVVTPRKSGTAKSPTTKANTSSAPAAAPGRAGANATRNSASVGAVCRRAASSPCAPTVRSERMQNSATSGHRLSPNTSTARRNSGRTASRSWYVAMASRMGGSTSGKTISSSSVPRAGRFVAPSRMPTGKPSKSANSAAAAASVNVARNMLRLAWPPSTVA